MHCGLERFRQELNSTVEPRYCGHLHRDNGLADWPYFS